MTEKERQKSGKIQVKSRKVTVLGVQGSGKTYFAKALVKKKNLTCLVRTPNYHDFKDEPDNFIIYNEPWNSEQHNNFWNYAEKLSKKGAIDCVLFDEIDTAYSTNSDIQGQARKVTAQHRHMGNLGIISIARRAQDIPAYLYEQGHFTVCFTLQAPNAIRKLNALGDNMGNRAQTLNMDDREYLVKEVGKKPVRRSSLQTIYA